MRVIHSAIVAAATAALASANGDPLRAGATYQSCDDMLGDGSATGAVTDDVFNCLFTSGLPDNNGASTRVITWVASTSSASSASTLHGSLTQAECNAAMAKGAWQGNFDMATGAALPASAGADLKGCVAGGGAPYAATTLIKDLLIYNSLVQSGFTLVASFPPGATPGTFGYCNTTVGADFTGRCSHAQCCTAHVATEGPFDNELEWPASTPDATGAKGLISNANILDDQIINARALDFGDCIGKASGDTCTVGCKAGSLSTTAGTPMTLYVDKNGKIVLPGLHTSAGTTIIFPLDVSATANRAIALVQAATAPAPVLTDSNSGMAGRCNVYTCNTALVTNPEVGFDYGLVGVQQTSAYTSLADRLGSVASVSTLTPALGATSFMKMSLAFRTVKTHPGMFGLDGSTSTANKFAAYSAEYGPCDTFLWNGMVAYDTNVPLASAAPGLGDECILTAAGLLAAPLGSPATTACDVWDTYQSRIIQGYAVPDNSNDKADYLGTGARDFTLVCDSAGAFDGAVNFQCTPNVVRMAGTANEVNTPATQGDIYTKMGVLAKTALGGVDFGPCEGLATGATCMPQCKAGYTQSTSDADGFRVVADADGVLYVNNQQSAAATTNLQSTAIQAGAVLEATGTNNVAANHINCFAAGTSPAAATTSGTGGDYNSFCMSAGAQRTTANTVEYAAGEYHPRVLGATFAEQMTMTCVPNKCWKGPDAATIARYPGINWFLDENKDGLIDDGETYQKVLDELAATGLTVPVAAVQKTSFFGTGSASADSSTNWGIAPNTPGASSPCLRGYSLKAGATVPALNNGLDTPNNCATTNFFSVTGIENICEPNVATSFYTVLNSGSDKYQDGSVNTNAADQTEGKEVFAEQGFAFINAEVRVGGTAAAYGAGGIANVGNTASTSGNRHYNGKDYSSCFNKKSGETCTPVCMAGFSETKSAGAGFPVVVNSFGQMLVGKQDYASYPLKAVVTGCLEYSGATAADCGTWDNRNAVRTSTATPEAIVTPAVAEADSLGLYAGADSLTCVAHTCDANKVINGGDFTSYFTCDGMTSMSTCRVACGPYRTSVPDATIFAAVANYLSVPAPTVDFTANYESNFNGNSGWASTTSTQKFGLSPNGEVTGALGDNYVLNCNVDGSFDMGNQFTCAPNVCNFDSVLDGATTPANDLVAAGLDFGSCVGMASNDTCTPTCKPGYAGVPADGARAPVLACNNYGVVNRDNNYYDGTAFAAGTTGADGSNHKGLSDYLTCTAQACTTVSAATADPAAAYSLCEGQLTKRYGVNDISTTGTLTGAQKIAIDATNDYIEFLTPHGASLGDMVTFTEEGGGAAPVSWLSTGPVVDTTYCVYPGEAGAGTTNPTTTIQIEAATANTPCPATIGTAVTLVAPISTGNMVLKVQFHGPGCTLPDGTTLSSCSTGNVCNMNANGEKNAYCGQNGLITASTNGLGKYTLPLMCDGTVGANQGVFVDPAPTARVCAAHTCSEGMASSKSNDISNQNSGRVPTVDLQNACNGKSNGEQCVLGCAEGYVTVRAGDPFVLDYDEQPSGTKQTAMAWCTASDETTVFFNGVAAPGALNFKVGVTTGLTPTSDFISSALTNFNTPAGVASNDLAGLNGKSIWPFCQHGVCGIDVQSPIPGIDYAKCAGNPTGESCAYACKPGWKRQGAAWPAGLILQCAATATATAAIGSFTDTNFGKATYPECAVNTCQEVQPATAVDNVNYASCAGQTGATCTPTCKAGYSPVTPASQMTLVCGTPDTAETDWDSAPPSDAWKQLNGNTNTMQFSGVNTLTCGKTCTFGANDLATVTDNADYTPCNGLGNGATCTPACKAGYFASTPATGFVLNCASLGSTPPIPFSATDQTLVCSVGSAGAAATAAPAAPAATTAAGSVPAATTAATAAAAVTTAASAQAKPQAAGNTVVSSKGQKAAKAAKATKEAKGNKVEQEGKAAKAKGKKGPQVGVARMDGTGKAGKASKSTKDGKNNKVAKASKEAKDAKDGKNGKDGKGKKGAKSALASKAATGATARKPVAYAASGVAVVVVLAAVVALATKHGLGPLSSAAGDVEEGHPLNAPGVHPVYA